MSSNIKATNILLDDTLLAEARALHLDASDVAEKGLVGAVKAEKERLWRVENADAIRAEREYVEKHGLPLAKFRQF